MRKLPLAVMTAVAIGGPIMEQQQIQPVPAIVDVVEGGVTFAFDRAGDVKDTAGNVLGDPDVQVNHDGEKPEHESFDRMLINLGETGMAAVFLGGLGLYGVRRWRDGPKPPPRQRHHHH